METKEPLPYVPPRVVQMDYHFAAYVIENGSPGLGMPELTPDDLQGKIVWVNGAQQAVLIREDTPDAEVEEILDSVWSFRAHGTSASSMCLADDPDEEGDHENESEKETAS